MPHKNKEIKAELARQRYLANAEKRKAKAREYYHKNREIVRAKQNARQRDPSFLAYARDYQLRKKFGIGAEEYNRLFEKQAGRCAVCRSTSTGRKDRSNFAVDHDHQTNKVRGLLCVQCNTAAGNLKDDPDLCLKLAEYLKKSGA